DHAVAGAQEQTGGETEQREAPVRGQDVRGTHSCGRRDLLPGLDVRPLGIGPDVLGLGGDRVAHTGKPAEEVLVPAQFHDLVEAVELLHLRDRQPERELVELLDLGDDDAAPVGHRTTLRAACFLGETGVEWLKPSWRATNPRRARMTTADE